MERTLAVPTSRGLRVAGWLVATAIFATSLLYWYGFGHDQAWQLGTISDSPESSVPAVAIEDGALQCAYLAINRSSVPPLYPLIAGGLMAATRSAFVVGPWVRTLPCPSLGEHQIGRRFPLSSFLLTGLVAWPALLAGFVLLLKTAGRTGTRAELAGCWLIAVIPALAGAYAAYFHPEDVLALGLTLGGLALAIRRRWALAGLCLGVACCTKQFAVLAAIPLLVCAPGRRRLQFALAALGAAAVILLPLVLTMGRGMLVSLAGGYATQSNGSTIVGWLNLQGALRVGVSRGLPIVLAGVLAVMARKHQRDALYRPLPMTSLVAGALVLRLVFEVNLFSYYFLAASVLLVALDVLAGRLRLGTLAWVAATSALYPPFFESIPVQGLGALPIQLAVVVTALVLALGPSLRARPAAAARDVPTSDRRQVLVPVSSR
jgi:hypothetical protein